MTAVAMWRRVAAEVRRYTGVPGLLALSVVPLGAAATAISGWRRMIYFPDAAPQILTMGTAPGAAQAAAFQLATVGGVYAATVIAIFGWLVDIQYGMTATLLLFEQRRAAMLHRRLLTAALVVTAETVVTWLVVWATGASATALDPPPVGAPAPVAWSGVAILALKSLVTAFLYVGVAVTAAVTTRAITPTVAVMASLWVVTLPLTKVDRLREWLPHCWIADWMALPDQSQFVAYVWPRAADNGSAQAGWLIAAAALCALAVAVWTFLTGGIETTSE